MPSPRDSYLTLADLGVAEQKIKRSRFLAEAKPVAKVDLARAVVTDLRRRYHDARHVAYAWRLGENGEGGEVRNDDGEPSGTGGEPILTAIRSANLTDVVVAVARWFGGVKLGTGGLGRAYGGTAAAALAAAPQRRVHLGHYFELRLGYAQQNSVRHLLDACDGRVESEEYAAGVTWRLWLPRSRCEDFRLRLLENSAGRLAPEPLDLA